MQAYLNFLLYLSVYLPVCQRVYLSIHLSVFLPICLIENAIRVRHIKNRKHNALCSGYINKDTPQPIYNEWNTNNLITIKEYNLVTYMQVVKKLEIKVIWHVILDYLLHLTWNMLISATNSIKINHMFTVLSVYSFLTIALWIDIGSHNISYVILCFHMNFIEN